MDCCYFMIDNVGSRVQENIVELNVKYLEVSLCRLDLVAEEFMLMDREKVKVQTVLLSEARLLEVCNE
uniref:Uncharacterized protein n=1 Tax=Lepeophtheirus salmonis TaxID=72036 RepID=A0A0K2VA95_LEPSM